jgi:hypothetical protein
LGENTGLIEPSGGVLHLMAKRNDVAAGIPYADFGYAHPGAGLWPATQS